MESYALRPWSQRIKQNAPNALSLLRMALAPLITFLMLYGAFRGAFWVLVVAGLTDGADGALARTWGCESTIGAVLDAAADKLFSLCLFGALTWTHHLPLWLFVLIVGRDVLLIVGALFLWLTQRPLLRPHSISKGNTTLQILLAGAILLSWKWAIVPMVWLMVMATCVSSLIYLVQGWRLLTGPLQHKHKV